MNISMKQIVRLYTVCCIDIGYLREHVSPAAASQITNNTRKVADNVTDLSVGGLKRAAGASATKRFDLCIRWPSFDEDAFL